MLLRRLSTAAAGKVGAAVVGAQSCPRVAGPPPNLPAVVERLNQLQARFPAIIERRHRRSRAEVHDSALVCAGSVLVGDVKLAANVSIWHTAVLRGDLNYIEVGENSNAGRRGRPFRGQRSDDYHGGCCRWPSSDAARLHD